MKLTNEKIFNFLFALFLIVFFSCITIQHFITQEKFNNADTEKRYTIATVIDYLPGAKNPPRFEYIYSVNNKSFAATHSIISKLRLQQGPEMKKYIGEKFLVWFVVGEEDRYSRLLTDKPVKDSLLVEPIEGWSESELPLVFK